jgi:hypothetical protein
VVGIALRGGSMFVKFDVREEMAKLANGKRLKKGVTPQLLAMLALDRVRVAPKVKRDDSLDFLERLYRLEDTRV